MNRGALCEQSCRAGWTDYAGWRAIELSNGLIRAVVVPDIGGRISRAETVIEVNTPQKASQYLASHIDLSAVLGDVQVDLVRQYDS